RELRSQLGTGTTPYAFRTGSDTEVLLAAWSRWGVQCLHRFKGMFAFAIHDAHNGEVFLVRDRMGIKPLYHHRTESGLLFASEIRSLFASGLVPRRLDRTALVDQLRYQTVHAPATIIKDVHMLQAGHYMRIGKGVIDEVRWYDPVSASSDLARDLSPEEVLREVSDRSSRAVERRMVADVPFGAFLSGGIDSSAIVGLMARSSTAPVHTFSVVFDESEYSEERFARLVARRFNTDHTSILLKPAEMLRLLPDALAAMDHPSADGPNTYVVSKVTKEAGVSMALSGLGGDEVFAGYPVFRRTVALWHRRWVTTVPVSLRKGVAASLRRFRPSIKSTKVGDLLMAPGFGVADTYPVSRLTFSDHDLLALLDDQGLPENQVGRIIHGILDTDHGNRLPMLSQVSLGELATYLQNVLLRDTDQMSMAHALEVRVPFLDHELIEFVLGVPDARKYPHTPKKLLTSALKDLLPNEVIDRPKMGFVMPWELWMREELRTFCAERLQRLGARSVFRKGAVMVLWERFLARDPRVNWSRLWSLVVLQDWLERHQVEE
ncbi:MAG: asparagine synthase (glutamine-hydrolyzing), partial [Flavobacteriales bacterium]|nr:asparagine synthase (glutamine-hydrolyzing) [Flavobacteriales bacterium]